MENFDCQKCGAKVYKTSLGRLLEDYNKTLITHHCKNISKKQGSQKA